ncbi:MAG: hypothetical protein KKF62_15600 [Bacteroidetes bacterium]|nr:hypothetical protein [Bacteroidota bacterium]MBU1115995.1 hypothetical protein [Bacteroidota bacterium]MBU1799237.1 hypothetical protein [Bacteroidota bacterium]
MNTLIRNTGFDNYVNYETGESSLDLSKGNCDNSTDPSSLSYLLKNNILVQYSLANIISREVTQKPDEQFQIVK